MIEVMRKKALIVLITAMLAVGIVATGCGSSKNPNNNNAGFVEEVQSEAKDDVAGSTENAEAKPYVLTFTGTTLAGDTLTSECFADAKLTMVNVWATFCGPCINEMPDLGEIAAEYDAADFQLIGIISDVIEGDEGETFTEAQEIIAQTGANYTHLLLNEELYVNLVGASDSVPTTYFFNEKGELLGYLVGAQSKDVWKQIIDELLAEVK